MASSVKNSGHSSNRSSSRQATYSAYSSSRSRRRSRRLSVRKFSVTVMRPPSQFHHPPTVVIERSDRPLVHHVRLRLVPIAAAHLHDAIRFRALPDAALDEFDHLAVIDGDEPCRTHQVRLPNAALTQVLWFALIAEKRPGQLEDLGTFGDQLT